MGTIVDLFSGCGGFSLGAELANFKSLGAVDIESTLQSAYRENFRNASASNADVKEIENSDWNRLIGRNRPDGLIGGPPCQGFSVIGKRDLDDPRNSLIGHFFRHLSLLSPKFFVMENVEGLLSDHSKHFLDSALNEVPGRYTLLEPQIVAAPHFGVPTRRKRVIIIGYDRAELGDFVASQFLGQTGRTRMTIRDAIEDLPPPQTTSKDRNSLNWAAYPEISSIGLSSYARYMRSMPPAHLGSELAREKLKLGFVSGLAETRHSNEIRARYRAVAAGKVDPITKSYKLEWEGIAPTLRAGTGSEKGSFQAVRPLHPSEGRVITVREAARIQGFPDWFTFHPTKWHSFRMIGNSVSPLVSLGILSPFADRLQIQKAA